ncbi:hypothetical protein Hanom_Chr03g00216781 [Helianthus anomalus]
MHVVMYHQNLQHQSVIKLRIITNMVEYACCHVPSKPTTPTRTGIHVPCSSSKNVPLGLN